MARWSEVSPGASEAQASSSPSRGRTSARPGIRLMGQRMATQVQFFMSPDDEVAFFRHLERFELEVYPRRVPPDWETFRASQANVPRLPEEDLYLVVLAAGPAI